MTKQATPVQIGKALTIHEVFAEIREKMEAEAKRRAAMTPEELAAQKKKDAENDKEVAKIMKQLPGLTVFQFGGK